MTGGTPILEAARALRPTIREQAAEVAAERQLPKGLVEDLRATGVFGMAMPAAWGGPELPILDQLEVVEELSYADGAVGWCAMIGCDSGFYASFLDTDAARRLYPELDLVSAGYTAPGAQAQATRVDGGYRVSGRWTFGSGCTHADRIVGGALIDDAPADGRYPFRTFFLPMDRVEIIDTWRITGLQGSGSHDYAVAEAVVPDEHVFYPLDGTNRPEPLYGLAWWFITKVAGVPLGLARRAIDELAAIAETKVSMPSLTLLRDEARAHAAVAQAEAWRASARAYLWDAMGTAWAALEAGDEVSLRQRASIRLAMANVASSCRQAVQLMYDTAATTAIFATCPLDQVQRDMTTAAQHMVLQTRNHEPVGRALLGLTPDAPMF